MAYSESIGTARLETLLEDVSNILNQSMMRQIGRVTSDPITAAAGVLYYESQASKRAALNDKRDSMVGFGNDNLIINSEASERTYSCKRFAVAEGFDRGLAPDVIYSQLRARVNDRLLERITFDQDNNLLYPILNGTGTEATSRNVTVVDQTSAPFSTDGTEVLDILDEYAIKHGCTRLILSTDAARVLRGHAKFKELSPLGHAGNLTFDALVNVLVGHVTNLNEVVIGNRVYQDGSSHLATNITNLMTGVTYMDDGRNITIVPFGSRRQSMSEDDHKDKEFYHFNEYLDCIALDPYRSVAFTNAYA
jgi:hypothetical protein